MSEKFIASDILGDWITDWGGSNQESRLDFHTVTSSEYISQFHAFMRSTGQGQQIDSFGWGSTSSDYTFKYTQKQNYVKWTQTSVVPIPAGIYFMSTAILGLLGFSRNRSQTPA